MKLLKNLGYIENIIITILAMLLPWSILFASPQLHIGYWGQVEGMIVFNHFSTAIISLLLLRIVILNKDDSYVENFGKQWRDYRNVQIDSMNNFSISFVPLYVERYIIFFFNSVMLMVIKFNILYVA